MNTKAQRTKNVQNLEEEVFFNSGNMSIQPAKKVEPEYLKKIITDVQELLKDVKTTFSEDIVGERNR